MGGKNSVVLNKNCLLIVRKSLGGPYGVPSGAVSRHMKKAEKKPIHIKLSMTVHNNDPDLTDLREAATVLEKYGFWGIEPDIVDPKRIDRRTLAGIVDEHDLQIPALATGRGFTVERLSLSDPDPNGRQAAIDRVRSHIDLACDLHTNVIIGLLRGIRGANDSVNECLRRLTDSLAACGQYAAHHGCTILFEALNRHETNIANKAAEAASLIAATGSPAVKLLLVT